LKMDLFAGKHVLKGALYRPELSVSDD
jgi:hypothetical protein